MADLTHEEGAGTTVSAPRPPVLRLEAASKAYEATIALSNVSFELLAGEVLGLVGENGAGKSTLLGTLNGTVRPDTGTLLINGHQAPFGNPHALAELGVATVFQEQALVGTMTVYENLFLGREHGMTAAGWLSRKQMRERAGGLLESLDINVRPHDRLEDLSFAQRQMVEIARAFALGTLVDAPPIILLDEPTSALSDAERSLLFERVAEWRDRASFILVSHRIEEILGSCQRLLVMKDGEVVATGETADVTEEELHELMVGRKRDVEYYKESRQRTAIPDEPILVAAGISVEGRVHDVSLEVRPGEIVGLAGVVGSGKSELAAAVAGASPLSAGDVHVGPRRLRSGSVASAIDGGVGYVPPERALEGFVPYWSVLANLTIVGLRDMRIPGTPLLSGKRQAAFVADAIERLGIRPPRSSALAVTLSGGNQQKVVLGKWLARKLKVLILDDPTRGVDVGVKEDIYALIRDWADEGIAIVLVSDNLHELIALSNRILAMKDGRITAEVPCPATDKPREAVVVRHMV